MSFHTTWQCVKDTDKHTVYVKDDNYAAIIVFWSLVLPGQSPENNRSHRLGYQMDFITIEMQLKYAIAFSYWDSPLVGTTIWVSSDPPNVLDAKEQEDDDLESKEGMDIPEMGPYFISSKISEKWVLTPFLVHLALLFACVVASSRYSFRTRKAFALVQAFGKSTKLILCTRSRFSNPVRSMKILVTTFSLVLKHFLSICSNFVW